jgi:hypothetical protein
VPVQPGNSGGALVDERGNVVGVVSARLSEPETKERKFEKVVKGRRTSCRPRARLLNPRSSRREVAPSETREVRASLPRLLRFLVTSPRGQCRAAQDA